MKETICIIPLEEGKELTAYSVRQYLKQFTESQGLERIFAVTGEDTHEAPPELLQGILTACELRVAKAKVVLRSGFLTPVSQRFMNVATKYDLIAAFYDSRIKKDFPFAHEAWENNNKTLKESGAETMLIVLLTNELLEENSPGSVIEILKEYGFSHVDFFKRSKPPIETLSALKYMKEFDELLVKSKLPVLNRTKRGNEILIQERGRLNSKIFRPR